MFHDLTTKIGCHGPILEPHPYQTALRRSPPFSLHQTAAVTVPGLGSKGSLSKDLWSAEVGWFQIVFWVGLALNLTAGKKYYMDS